MLSTTLRTARLFLFVAALAAPTMAQSLSPSVPSVSTPVPGTPALTAENISDLNSAPPVATAAIVDLVTLGIYPLEDGSLAKPNELISQKMLAFMMVNLLTPGITGEYPLDPDAAASYLDVVSKGALSTGAGGTVSGTTYLAVLFALLDLPPEQVAPTQSAIEERYPAFRSGHPDTLLTRAGAALLLWQSLAILRES